jgi:serine/threonine-protein kinase
LSLKARQTFGKYRIERRLGEGGFATVLRAYDTIEGIRVALKIPHAHLLNPQSLELFRQEVRVSARLDHPNILPIKYAGFIDGIFAIVYPLGDETLASRLTRRVALPKALDWAGQMLAAVAYAHRRRILHSDLKPENFLFFGEQRLRLADFGLARVSHGTMSGSGSGTVGYIAPEQGLGRPSLRSDVFSLGLILYRMFAGVLHQWPFDWPPPGYARLRARVHPGMIELLRKALEIDHRKRFPDAVRMQAAFERARVRTQAASTAKKRKRRAGAATRWREVRFRDFQRRFGKPLETRFQCGRCGGPVSEPMHACPWCGRAFKRHVADTTFPERCPRCKRGRKLDWRFCAWCYGPGFRTVAERAYSDRRYSGRCANRSCPDGRLIPFMKYCPWCHRKVRRPWPIAGASHRCGGCGWDVVAEFWEHCPWCTRKL